MNSGKWGSNQAVDHGSDWLCLSPSVWLRRPDGHLHVPHAVDIFTHRRRWDQSSRLAEVRRSHLVQAFQSTIFTASPQRTFAETWSLPTSDRRGRKPHNKDDYSSLVYLMLREMLFSFRWFSSCFILLALCSLWCCFSCFSLMSRLDSLCHRWTGSEASHSIAFFFIKQEEMV